MGFSKQYETEFKRRLGSQGIGIPNTHEKSTKNQSATEWYRWGKCGAMDKDAECLCCHEVKAVEYFELLDMRNGDKYAISLKLPVK